MNRHRSGDTIISKYIKAKYVSDFDVDWIEKYDWSNKSSIEESHKIGIKKISDFIDHCFVYFCKSIISGEYIIKGQIDNDLSEICEIIGNEYQPNDSIPLKQQLYQEYQKLDENIFLIVNKYRHFIYTITNKINQEHHQYIVNAIYTNGKIISIPQFDVLYNRVFDIFMLDHSLSYDKVDLQRLILIFEELNKKESLKSESIKPIYKILKEKCSFLIKKLVYFNDGLNEYAVDFSRKEININDVQSEAFKDFDVSFNFFHKEVYLGNEPMVLDWQRRCQNKSIKIGQMILLMKYYKDYKGSVNQQVDNLIKAFDSLYKNLLNKFSERQFDIYALYTLKNYMYNSRLSFRMKHNYTFDKLCVDMDEIEGIQADTHIKNFYPYKKAVKFLIDDIRGDFNNEIFSEDSIMRKFSYLNEYIDKFNEAVIWCKEEKFYPVQNMYNECIVRDTAYGGVVFMASSYSRPIKYDKLYDDIEEFKSEARLLKNEISLFKERAAIAQLKKEIDASKKSNIEILGAFTAVITFLFGCVNIFSDNENVNRTTLTDNIANIIGLGLILLLFVSAIYFLTVRRESSWTEYFKHPRFIVFGLSIIVYMVVLFLYLFKIF